MAFGDTVYAGCFDGMVYALNAESGAEIAALDLGSPVRSWPILVEDRIIVATEAGKVYSIDTENNQEQLLGEIGEAIYAPLCYSEGVIYVYTQAQNLYALNADSGARLWSLPIE